MILHDTSCEGTRQLVRRDAVSDRSESRLSVLITFAELLFSKIKKNKNDP